MSRTLRCCLLVVVLFASPLLLANTAILANYPGLQFTDSNCGCLPPDTTGAAGPNHVVELVNFEARVLDKTTGSTLLTTDFTNFLGGSNGAFNGGDARVIFDSASQRWFMTTLTSSFDGIVLARSNDSNPLDGWKTTTISLPSGHVADRPTIAVDANAIYIGTNDLNGGVSSDMFTIPKADIVAATPSLANMTSFTGLDQSKYGWLPVATPGGFLATASSTDASTAIFTPVNGAGAPGATLGNPVSVSGLTNGIPVMADQPGSLASVQTNFNDLAGGVVRVGNLLYAANTISVGGRDEVHWMIIDALTGTVLGQGTIGAPGLDFYYPSIAANASGDFVIGFNESGNTEFISAFAAACFFNGVSVICDTPLLLAAGVETSSFTFRWGDYSGTVLDPSDPSHFWTFQEFAPENSVSNIWATQVTELGVEFAPSVPEPGTLALLGIGLAGLGFSCRARKQ